MRRVLLPENWAYDYGDRLGGEDKLFRRKERTFPKKGQRFVTKGLNNPSVKKRSTRTECLIDAGETSVRNWTGTLGDGTSISRERKTRSEKDYNWKERSGLSPGKFCKGGVSAE